MSQKQVPARAPSIMSGFLTILNSSSKGKKENNSNSRTWHSLRPDFVLYSFSSQDAKSALTATPVPGCSVQSDLQDKPEQDPDDASSLVIRMSFAHPTLGREYSFLADDLREARRYFWNWQLVSSVLMMIKAWFISLIDS